MFCRRARRGLTGSKTPGGAGTHTGKKTPGGAGTHTGHTGAHGHTDITQTNLTTIQTPNPRPREASRPLAQPLPRPLPGTEPWTNLNRGQDTRANRTRHTTSSSTQPHAKQQPTNAPRRQTSRSHAHTHLPIGERVPNRDERSHQCPRVSLTPSKPHSGPS